MHKAVCSCCADEAAAECVISVCVLRADSFMWLGTIYIRTAPVQYYVVLLATLVCSSRRVGCVLVCVPERWLKKTLADCTIHRSIGCIALAAGCEQGTKTGEPIGTDTRIC